MQRVIEDGKVVSYVSLPAKWDIPMTAVTAEAFLKPFLTFTGGLSGQSDRLLMVFQHKPLMRHCLMNRDMEGLPVVEVILENVPHGAKMHTVCIIASEKALLASKAGDMLPCWMGEAFCGPNDDFSRREGRIISAQRALHAFGLRFDRSKVEKMVAVGPHYPKRKLININLLPEAKGPTVEETYGGRNIAGVIMDTPLEQYNTLPSELVYTTELVFKKPVTGDYYFSLIGEEIHILRRSKGSWNKGPRLCYSKVKES